MGERLINNDAHPLTLCHAFSGPVSNHTHTTAVCLCHGDFKCKQNSVFCNNVLISISQTELNHIQHNTHCIQMSSSFIYLCRNTYITYCCLISKMKRFYLDLGKLWFCCTQGKTATMEAWPKMTWNSENMPQVIDQFDPIPIVMSTTGVNKVVSAVSRLIEKCQYQ